MGSHGSRAGRRRIAAGHVVSDMASRSDPPSGLRVRQKEARRQAILDAAEALIRENGSADFSMQALSGRAGLSRATPFNLFGSKSAILYALLARSLGARLRREMPSAADPYEHLLRCAEGGARHFVSDPVYYRTLHRFVLGVADSIHRPAFMKGSLDFWREASRPLVDAGEMPPGMRHDMFAMLLRNHFGGSVDYWVVEDLTDAQFTAQIYFGAVLALLSLATGERRAWLLAKLEGAAA